MAIPPDNDNDAWEDEDAQRQGLGTTTHRNRNPHKAVIARRGKWRSRVIGAKRSADEEAARVNTCATAKKCRGTQVKNLQGLAADLDKWQEESEERTQELAETYRMKLKEVHRRMQATSGFKDRCKVSLYNTKILALMVQFNEDCDVGHRYLMTDIKRMVKEDPSMLDGFTKEEEEEMVAGIHEKRETKHRGARANNLAASADAKRMVEHLMEEITGLAERSAMIGFAMFTRGHVHDSSIPVTIESWGALSFFREVLKRDPADVSGLFELWGVTRVRGNMGAETLLSMQKECTKMIKTSLCGTKIAMNSENYVKAIVEALNVGLLGWPKGVDFKRMSKQSAIGPLRTLRNALKAGTCRWAILTASQKKQLLSEFKKMVENGEATEKEQKGRGKGKRKEAGEGRKSTCAGSKRTGEPLSDNDGDEHAGEEEEEEEEEVGSVDDDEERPHCSQHRRTSDAVSGPKAQRERLLALVAKRGAAASSKGKHGDKASKSTKATGMRKRCADYDSENDNDTLTWKPSGKRKHRADNDSGSDKDNAPAPKATRKHKRRADDNDDSGSDNDNRPAPKAAGKRKHRAADYDDNGNADVCALESASSGKHRHPARESKMDDDNARTAKKKPRRAEKAGHPPHEDNNTRAANQQKTSAMSTSKGGARDSALSGSRPKPKPLYKGALMYKGALTDGGSTSPASPHSRSPSHSTPLSRSVSPSGTTAAPVHPPPKSPSPSTSHRGSAADGATAMSSAAPRRRANVVRGRREGPLGRRAVL
ncbi:hypothetical protein B0H14DRAFT_3523839 [Mycena olivaceomarginata]|nr:hypothetical protein B0H14DRAFT_3523839 [Mycena olivaceomarginata]